MIFALRDVLRDGTTGAPNGAPPPKTDQPPARVKAGAVTAATTSPSADAAAGTPPVKVPTAEVPQKRRNKMMEELLSVGGIRVGPEGQPVKVTEKVVTPPQPKRRAGAGMAKVNISGKRSPNLGILGQALGEQQRAQVNLTKSFQRQEAEKAKVLTDTSRVLAGEANRLAEQREKAMQDAIARTRKLQAQADELGAMAPSAGRLFGSDAQAASFGAALSIATGAMLSARVGGENVALKIIDRAIQRDMESQREAIKSKQYANQTGLQLAQEMRATFRDDVAASNAMQATLMRYTENRLQAVIAQTNDQVLRARGEEAIANVRMQYAQIVEEVTRQDFGVTMALPLRKAQAMLAASQGQTLPPISTPDMQADASKDGGVATQRGLEAASVGAAESGKEADATSQKAGKAAAREEAKTRRRSQRRPQAQALPADHPLAQYGIQADPQNPSAGIVPDGSGLRIPLGAKPMQHAGQSRSLFQRIEVSPEFAKQGVIWPGWKLAPGKKDQWVRVGSVSTAPLTAEERKAYAAAKPRTVTILDTVPVADDLTSTELRTGGRRVTIPPYPGIEKDLAEFNSIASDLSEWKRLYDDVISQFDQSMWDDIADKKADARVLAAVALFNRNISQGGVLNAGEVKTIGSFLNSPASWSAFANKGGWEAMDEMMREHYSAKARKIQHEGSQPPLNTERAKRLKAAAKTPAVGRRGKRK